MAFEIGPEAVLRTSVLVAGVSMFALTVWAARFHFTSSAMPLKLVIISILATADVAVFAHATWRHPRGPLLLGAALALFVASAALCLWAIAASRSAALKLAFDPHSPRSILEAGPYRYIRHPFYSAYIVFWTACAVATLHPVNVVLLPILAGAFVAAALGEERAFDRSPEAAAYAAYRHRAGMLWPKLVRGTR